MIAKGIFTRYAIWAIILISGPLYATPSISVITGTTSLVQGGTITISGTGFTSYSTTTGTFDTFESGNFGTYWADTNDLHINSGGLNQRNVNSLVNVSTTMINGATDHGHFQGANTVSRNWYVSFWWKVDPAWVWGTSDFSGTHKWLSNIKLIRFWNPGSTAENLYIAWTGFNTTAIFTTEGYSAPNLETRSLHISSTNLSVNTWHQFRFQFVDSSSLGAADGSVQIFFDTRTVLTETGKVFKDAENLNKRPQAIGLDNVWSCTEGTPDTGGCYPGTVYLDNVYAYDTIARVEICDDPTYTNCQAYPEIQHVNSWTGTSINVTYNEGSLTGSTTQYVFVVDNAGVASAGFALLGPAVPPTTSHSGLGGKTSLRGKGALK